MSVSLLPSRRLRPLRLLALVALSACGGGVTDSERQPTASPDAGSDFDAGTLRWSCKKHQDEVRISPGAFVGGLAVGDVNGDGKGDLAGVIGGACCNTQVPHATKLFRNATGRAFEPPSVLHADADYFAQTVADLNADGLADIAAASPSLNELAISLSAKDGTFATQKQPLPAVVRYVFAGDFNADTRVDIVAFGSLDGAGKLLSLRGRGDGSFDDAAVMDHGSDRTSVAAGDFDGDKNPDLAFGDGAQIGVLLSRNDVFWPSWTTAVAAGAPVAGDLDEDGIDDLVAVDRDENVLVFRALGGGIFGDPVIHAARPSTSGPIKTRVVGDFDGDGHLDVVFGRGGSMYRGALELWRGDGKGAIGDVVVQDNGIDASAMVASDVDADGMLDLVMSGTFGTGHPYLGVIFNLCGRL